MSSHAFPTCDWHRHYPMDTRIGRADAPPPRAPRGPRGTLWPSLRRRRPGQTVRRAQARSLDLAAAPIASGSRTRGVRLLARQCSPPRPPSPVPPAPYAPGWRSCGLAAPPAPPRPRPLALVPPRPSPRSSPRDCTPSTESAVAFTLTSRTRSRLPLSSSTGMPWAAGRRTGAGWEALEPRGRSPLRGRRRWRRMVKALGRRASCCEGRS